VAIAATIPSFSKIALTVGGLMGSMGAWVLPFACHRPNQGRRDRHALAIVVKNTLIPYRTYDPETLVLSISSPLVHLSIFHFEFSNAIRCFSPQYSQAPILGTPQCSHAPDTLGREYSQAPLASSPLPLANQSS